MPIPAHPQLPQAESPRSRKANQAFTIQASELHFAATAPSPADQKPSEVVPAPNRFENNQEPSIDPQPEHETSESVGGTPSFNHDSSEAIRAHLVPLSVESPRSRKPNQGIRYPITPTHIHPSLPPGTFQHSRVQSSAYCFGQRCSSGDQNLPFRAF